MLDQNGAAIVASLPRGPLDPTRAALLNAHASRSCSCTAACTRAGLAPDRTLTRYQLVASRPAESKEGER